MQNENIELKIGVVGLGYVGLPLLCALDQLYDTIGFDVNERRISELKVGVDATDEIKDQSALKNLSVSSDPEILKDCNFYVVTVPTPITKSAKPDFTPLVSASTLLGKYIKKGDLVIFESTVYPGATREVCLPELERHSGLIGSVDFYFGYSPERINPGDVHNSLKNVIKVTSGCCDFSANLIDKVYSSIIPAGTFKAASIEVAEASKIIENIQRDVNIAVMNEAKTIFNELNIDITDVLDAASTKWNFQRFSPGLVGGHCIGVDPYYLITKATSVGVVPSLFLAARERNESMVDWHVEKIVKSAELENISSFTGKILYLGLTFKPNVSDMRNSKSIELFKKLRNIFNRMDVHDPYCDPNELDLLGIEALQKFPDFCNYDLLVLSVSHDCYMQEFEKFLKNGGSVYVV